MGTKKKAKPRRKRNIFEIHRDATFRKLAKLLKKREKIIHKIRISYLEEELIECWMALDIERFLRDQKKR